jgi:hypothetical protein
MDFIVQKGNTYNLSMFDKNTPSVFSHLQKKNYLYAP